MNMVELERGTTNWHGTPYTIVRRIGAGAASEVYEARDESGAPCALKVLRDAHVGSEAAWRFARECALLASIRHPNLLYVRHSGVTDDGRPYAVTDLLRGKTLREIIREQGRVDPERATELLIGALDGLDRAHRAGIVHRDVKPGNIFVHDEDGGRERPIVIDFGAAIGDQPGENLTTDAHVFGTPRYLSPEQILGGAVDARTDVYAAGLTLFEVVSGRSPFNADTSMSYMHAHVSEAPLILADVVPVGRGLSRAVARSLEKEPAKRWPTARAFAAALRRVVAAAPPARAATRVASPSSSAQEGCRR